MNHEKTRGPADIPPLDTGLRTILAEHPFNGPGPAQDVAGADGKPHLDRLRSECGCQMGAIFSIVAVCGYFASIYLSPFGPFATSAGMIAVQSILVFLTAGLLGKVFGIAHARFRLRLKLRETGPPFHRIA